MRCDMLEVRKVSKLYGQGPSQVVALKDISMQVEDGDFVAITGPSGSRKSTLLNVIGGLEKLSGGEVILDGQRIDNLNENALVDIRRRKIAYVFQQYHLIPSLTALENLLLPLTFGGSNGCAEEKARELLCQVGLDKKAKNKNNQLRGGEIG